MNDYDAIDLRRLYYIIRRQIWFMLLITLLFGGCAAAYILTTVPKYTASTSLLLDRSFNGAVSDISVKRMYFDPAALQSEVEVVKSHRVIQLVIDNLIKQGYLQELQSQPDLTEKAIIEFSNNLKVSRAGETYVLNISYTAESPQDAAMIANAFAEAYITDQLNASSETSTRTFSWLDQKTEEIKSQLSTAQEKVNIYRYNYNLQKEAERSGRQSDNKGSFNLIDLLNLEKDVESLSSLLNSYIERREATSLQTSFPVSETRIISSAAPPKEASHPKKALILGAAIILGAGLSFLLALMRDYFDRGLRRAGQIKKELKVPFLGFFPRSSKKANILFSFHSPANDEWGVPLFGQSIENEYSLYTETIRSIKNKIDQKIGSKPLKVIGVVSTTPYEGVQEISTNLALYTGYTGHETLFIDGNFRRFTKLRSKKQDSTIEGLAGVLLRNKPLKEVALYNDTLNLSYLPSLPHESEEMLQTLNPTKVASFITRCQNHFQYVIIEIPPLIATADLCIYSQIIDGFVLVSEWGKTLSNNVNFYLQQNAIEKDKVVGVVLNRASMSKMRKFYGHTSYSR